MDRLHQIVQQSGPVGPALFIEQFLGERWLVDSQQQIVAFAKGNAQMSELTVEPFSTVEADTALVKVEPTLHADIAEFQIDDAGSSGSKVQTFAAFFERQFDPTVGKLAQAIGIAQFGLKSGGRDPPAGALLFLSELQSHGFLVDGRAIQVFLTELLRTRFVSSSPCIGSWSGFGRSPESQHGESSDRTKKESCPADC